MKYEIAFSGDEGFVRITVYELITADLERSFAKEAITAAKQNGVLRYLVDVRGVRNVASPLDQYSFAYEDMASLGLDRRARIAVLVGQDDHSHDFIETVFRNAGRTCQLFVDEDDASNWLSH